ncbi:hypothetical protein ACFOQM_23630 [Paenibacillus sp. GCM10012307]|uniref:Uncharacterized protein n=1 Tax=Paenibacillus roseus TaxID=2798579 RepID=A0A934J791_9BACL|nr:hypothetical protein [Paenibacillus roseus]MBJ6364215.1 hypothetical protein [Paenibacillus roseus]
MKLTMMKAIQTVAYYGGSIVSNKGTRFLAADIEPITKLGRYAVSCRNIAVTEAEIKGEWTHEIT